jgi:uncharacterized membrane protein YjdF
VIPILLEEVRLSRNANVRIKLSEYLYLLLSLWFPPHSSGPYQHLKSVIEDYLSHLIQDAKAEARQFARLAYFRYREVFY